MKKTLAIFGLLVAISIATAIIEPTFLGMNNISDMARRIGPYGLIALGAAFVIITGGIDLSIGSLICLAATLFALMVTEWNVAIPMAFVAVFGAGIVLGLIHGLLVTKLGLQPFVVTLCGLFIYRGAARYMAGDITPGFGVAFDGLRELALGRVFGVIPVPFVIVILVGILAAIFLNLTTYGRHLLALGRNEKAARYSGIRTDRLVITAYVICSVLAAFAGIIFALEQNSVQATVFGNFYELYAIAGAVLGGVSLRGGEGTIGGVLCGVGMVEIIRNAPFYLNVPDSLEFAVIGAVILLAVSADEIIKKISEKRRRHI